MSIKIIIWVIILTIPSYAYSQNERSHIRKGNKQYEKGEYIEAERAYARANSLNKESFEAAFNLANAMYKQGRYQEAAKHYDRLISMANGKEQKALIFYNLGNSLLLSDLVVESIEAYKKSLRNFPEDKDARYNLSYALSLLTDTSFEPQSIPEESQQILELIEKAEKTGKVPHTGLELIY
jgi:Ca-activated chloride channel homolog